MSGTHLPPMFASLRDVAGDRVEYARLSKATLADLSHVLEDIVEDRDRRSLVLTGFQVGRNWIAEMERYERLGAGERRSVAVFTDAALPDAVRVEPFLLREASGLRQEWFVLTLTEEFSCALFGIDHPELGDPVEEMDRVFDAAWTFDPELVRELVELVLREAQASDPDRAARLREAAAAVGTTSLPGDVERRFHREVFEVLEAGRRRLRRQLVLEQELHERLHRANLELLRLERLAAIGTTVASLAHELNNPLHAISMLADLIADAGPDELDAAREHAAQVAALTARAGRLTRGLLDLGRAAQPSPRRIALDAWLRDLAQEQTLAVRTEVVTDLAAGDVVVEVDPDRLRHVLTNLLQNAAQASEPGVAVSLASARVGDTAVVRVVDRGSGVPEAVRDVLFQPFVTSRPNGDGTGLGLALASRFAEDLGGALALEDTGPQGTTFRLRLPVAGGLPDPEVETPGVAARTVPTVPAGRRALVVDDQPEVRATIASVLRRLGWEVLAAGTVEEVQREAAHGPFDVVLLDYRFSPERSLPELVEDLRREDPTVPERVLVITGSLDSELPDDLDLPVLTKPFGRDDLVDAVERLLGGPDPEA